MIGDRCFVRAMHRSSGTVHCLRAVERCMRRQKASFCTAHREKALFCTVHRQKPCFPQCIVRSLVLHSASSKGTMHRQKASFCAARRQEALFCTVHREKALFCTVHCQKPCFAHCIVKRHNTSLEGFIFNGTSSGGLVLHGTS